MTTSRTQLPTRSYAPATRQAHPVYRCSIVELISRQENRASVIPSASDEFPRALLPDWGRFLSRLPQPSRSVSPPFHAPFPHSLKRSRQPRSHHPIPMVQGRLGGSALTCTVGQVRIPCLGAKA